MLVLLGVAFAVWWHAAVLAPFVLSLALAYVLAPIKDHLVKRRCPASLAALVCVLMALLLSLLLVALLVPVAINLVPLIQQQLPNVASDAWHAAVVALSQWGVHVPAELTDLRPLLLKLVQSHASDWANTLLSSLRIGGGWAMTAMGLFVLVPMLTFYWLIDGARLGHLAHAWLPLHWHATWHELTSEADNVMGQYLRGQITVMLVLALYYSLGLWMFGFDLAWPIGVFTGLAVFIPYVGFGLGLLLALLSGTLQFAAQGEASWWPLLAVAVVYGSGQFVESMFLTPRWVGERIGLHPIGVILSLMLFGQWMGFVGVLVALPVSALFMVLLRYGQQRYQASAFYQGRT